MQAREYGDEVLEKLFGIVRDEKIPANFRVMAGREILDRGYGKAAQPVRVSGGVDAYGTVYNRLQSGGAIILINRRMHEDDLAGRLIAASQPLAQDWRRQVRNIIGSDVMTA